MVDNPSTRSNARKPGSVGEVFWTFLRLGLTSFGGPIAHLGYFRSTCVQRLRWLDDARYSELVALCQFLPGPASSQVGMALGMQRAGLWGALAAWAGFTLPSAAALVLLAQSLAQHPGWSQSGWVHGLKIAAVAVVAQAVWGMARNLCTTRVRVALAVLAFLVTWCLAGVTGQLLALLGCAAVGAVWLEVPPGHAVGLPALAVQSVRRRWGVAALLSYGALLAALPLWAAATSQPVAGLVSGVYRAGALVFGGGHVVLPLLESVVVAPGWLTQNTFLAGYGAAQAVPGPLFTFAAYIGALLPGALHGSAGAGVLLVAIFLPGFLVLAGVLRFWDALRQKGRLRAAVAGTNAGVVGLLAAAWVSPVFTGAIGSVQDGAVAMAALLLLMVARLPPAAVVALCALAGWVLQRL